MSNMRLILILTAIFVTLHTKAQELSVSATETASAPVAPVEFKPTNKFSGDFRYRHQETKDDTKDTRRIHRLMVRVGQNFEIQPDLKFTYRLMTGTNNNSGNTTIADGGTNTQGSPRYTIGLDQAYVTYLPEQNLTLFLGKMPQFFYTPAKHQVILDRDITPEGLGLKYKYTLIEKVLDFNLNAASFWIREKYNSAGGKDLTDSFLNSAQAVVNYSFLPHSSAQFGLGSYTYTDIKGMTPNSLTVQSTPDFRGNTQDGSGNYLNNYKILQASLELKWRKSPYEVSLFFDHLKNNGADTGNKAQIYGLLASYDKFSLTYMRQTIENDAVLAIFTNADQAGGVTDSRGQVYLLGYKLNKNAVVNFSLNDFEKNVSTSPTTFRVSQLDLTINF